MANNQSTMKYTVNVKTDIESINKMKNIISKEVVELDTKQNYVLLNYDKNYICNDDHEKRLYNCVVLDPKTRNILSIGCTKSYDLATYKSLYKYDEDIVLEDMIEGLFVQLFYDPRMEKWEMCTRNSIAGKYSYYRMPHIKSSTYRNMLFDAMGIDRNKEDFQEWKGIEYMNPTSCYHFILQHPENHIVFKHETPRLYYVGRNEMHCNNTTNAISYYSAHSENVFPNNMVNTPSTHDISCFKDYDEVISAHGQIEQNLKKMGISFLNKNTGDRCFVISPNYEELQLLRGSHPNILYQYLCLRRINKIKDFLKHFPQYKQMFWSFHTLYENAIKKIHQTYLHYFIQKQKIQLDKAISYHIHYIHNNIYKPSLQEDTKVIIKKEVVRKYMDELEPGCILHLVQNDKYIQDKMV